VLWSIDRDPNALEALVAELRDGDAIGKKSAFKALRLMTDSAYWDERGPLRIYPPESDRTDLIHLRPTEADLSKIASTKGAVLLLVVSPDAAKRALVP
jgi:hypothetical protein